MVGFGCVDGEMFDESPSFELVVIDKVTFAA